MKPLPNLTSASCLLVDDYDQFRELMARYLRVECAIAVETAASAEEALAKLERRSYDVLVADYYLKAPLDGADLIRMCSVRWPNMRRVLLTSHTTGEMFGELPADEVLDKMLHHKLVLETICRRAKTPR